MSIDSTGDIVAIFAIISGLFGLLLWIIKAQINISKQFQPNGGSSMRDSVNRIEHDQRYLRDRLDAHLDKHN